MKSIRLLALAGLGLALVAGSVFVRSASAEDDEAALVRKRCGAFVQAFNSHDAKGMAAAFAPDGDVISPVGVKLSGHSAIEKMYAEGHTGTGPFREATLEVKDEPIRFITPDVAISDADVVVTNAYGPDGKKAGPMSLTVTNVWKKVDGEWWIAASRPALRPTTSPHAGANR